MIYREKAPKQPYPNGILKASMITTFVIDGSSEWVQL